MYSVVLVAAMVGTPSVPACHLNLSKCLPKISLCAPKCAPAPCAPKCAPVACEPKCAPVACEPKPCAVKTCDPCHKISLHSIFSKLHHKKSCDAAPACDTCPTATEVAPAPAPEVKPMPKPIAPKAEPKLGPAPAKA